MDNNLIVIIALGVLLLLPIGGIIYGVKIYLDRKGENTAVLPSLDKIGVESVTMPTVDPTSMNKFKQVDFKPSEDEDDEGSAFFHEIAKASGQPIIQAEKETRRSRRLRRE